MKHKRNLLLTFDAFGTLFTPRVPIATSYARAGQRHGIQCGDASYPTAIAQTFKSAFQQESLRNPNYGKVSGLGAEKWWTNVIKNTFQPHLAPHQAVPKPLVLELLHMFSSKEGYALFPDAAPFFEFLRRAKVRSTEVVDISPWPFQKTVVGVVTNSDPRVPSILSSLGLSVGDRRFGDAEMHAQSLVSQAGLDCDIDFIVMSYDVGFEKPDSRIFDAAKSILGEMTRDDFECVHVGDELDKDVEGAIRAGWRGVQLVREGKDGVGSNVENVTSLKMLPKMLSSSPGTD